MARYLAKRLALAALTLLLILMVSYALVRLAPGDPAKGEMIGENAAVAEGLSTEKGALSRNVSLRRKLHLDKPIMVGFSYWLRDVLLHGDFGDSASVDKGRPVLGIIMERLPVTLRINVFAIILTYFLAIPIGIHSATRPGTRLDQGMTFFLFFLYSLPTFWVALVLQAAICEGGWLPLFPLRGVETSKTWGVGDWRIFFATAKHYVLPVFCLSYAGFAGLSRYARTGMIEVVNQDYIRTARAKGLPESVVILKHALRNALIVLITLFAGLLPGLVAGSIFIEYVFNIPGMGSLSMMALTSRDIPLLMTLFAFGGALTLGGIIISDILYVVVDPRISFERRAGSS